jgi:hypothetical protein
MSAVEAVCDVSEKLLTIFLVSLAYSKNYLRYLYAGRWG